MVISFLQTGIDPWSTALLSTGKSWLRIMVCGWFVIATNFRSHKKLCLDQRVPKLGRWAGVAQPVQYLRGEWLSSECCCCINGWQFPPWQPSGMECLCNWLVWICKDFSLLLYLQWEKGRREENNPDLFSLLFVTWNITRVNGSSVNCVQP